MENGVVWRCIIVVSLSSSRRRRRCQRRTLPVTIRLVFPARYRCLLVRQLKISWNAGGLSRPRDRFLVCVDDNHLCPVNVPPSWSSSRSVNEAYRRRAFRCFPAGARFHVIATCHLPLQMSPAAYKRYSPRTSVRMQCECRTASRTESQTRCRAISIDRDWPVRRLLRRLPPSSHLFMCYWAGSLHRFC